MVVRHTMSGLAVMVLVTLAVLVGAPAAEATPVPSGGKHCVTIIEKVPGQGSKSRVVSNDCTTGSTSLAVPADSVPLITFWQNDNYSGWSNTVYGKSGPCDSEGYGMSDLSVVQINVDGISSYTYDSNCDEQRYYDGLYYGGDWRTNFLDQPYVGDLWNDNLWSMQVWNG